MARRSSRQFSRRDRRRPGEVKVAALHRRRSGGGGPDRDPGEPPEGGGLVFLVAGFGFLVAWAVVASNLGV